MGRMSNRQADAYSKRVDAALAALAQTKVTAAQALTAQQKRLWSQLGAYHRLKLKREHPYLYDRLMSS
jgi:hypothetical protein